MTDKFNQTVERKDSDSLKWDEASRRDVIPMWVADMDFAAPECVTRALAERVSEGVFGYPVVSESAKQAVVSWANSHYNWQIDPEWITWLPGLVSGIHLACKTLVSDHKRLITLAPAYPPLLTAPIQMDREIITAPLTNQGSRWSLDLDVLTQAITPRTQAMLLCNPHNPVGRAYERDELLAIANICERYGLMVCSDEIHCDLMLEPRRHIPFATLSPEIAARTVTLMSPSKTFNLSGIGCGFAIISNSELRQRFREAQRDLVPSPNLFGYVACQAAYSEGEPWRQELIEYLRGNRDLLKSFFERQLPQFTVSDMEATYLAWIDVRWLGNRNAGEFFAENGVRLSDGTPFEGAGFIRMNFACSRTTLQQALERMATAVRSIM